jgi:tRNA (5-methylaminomethyl-2-thiouridylate)-methyltransferase
MNRQMKTAVLLSGGVDSSVALSLLKEQGYDVTAFYLQIWLEDEMAFMGKCPWKEDIDYAQAVCDKLDVPLRIVNMQAEYFNTVVDYTIKELKAGRTPSPDVMCNRHIKFGQFINKIDSTYELIASRHYAKIENLNNKYYLKSAPDKVKDQTYFLTYLKQEQLKKIIFPIGNLNKKQVRELAQKYDLPTKNRKDSQGICFLGKIKYNDFVWYHLRENKGDIIDIQTGKKMGEHNGYWYYTIGQRQGIGLGGGPWYVVKKNIEKNIIYISTEKLYMDVPRDTFHIRDINWIPEEPKLNKMQIKLRHGPNKYNCDIEIIENGKVTVRLDEKDEGIAPGQFAVFYDGDYCIGGGIIE